MHITTIYSDTLQLVSFRLGTQRYAVDILKVEEIDNMKEITNIPNAPPYLAGAINLRGKVIPVLSLRSKFGMETNGGSENGKIVIIDIKGAVMGIIVDSVSDVLRIPTDMIEPPPQVTSRLHPGLIRGIAKLHEGLVLILDMDKLLDADEQNVILDVKQTAGESNIP
jgi:purine-binding chemotaxis protein CheW